MRFRGNYNKDLVSFQVQFEGVFGDELLPTGGGRVRDRDLHHVFLFIGIVSQRSSTPPRSQAAHDPQFIRKVVTSAPQHPSEKRVLYVINIRTTTTKEDDTVWIGIECYFVWYLSYISKSSATSSQSSVVNVAHLSDSFLSGPTTPRSTSVPRHCSSSLCLPFFFRGCVPVLLETSLYSF